MISPTDKSTPELRFPAYNQPWLEHSLGEYMTFKNGINADKSCYGSGYKFINVLDIISNGPITHEHIIGSVQVTETEYKKNEVIYGDILFQRSSEIRKEAGQSNIYIDSEKSATFGGFVIRGRPIKTFNPFYFDYLLKTSAVRKEITTKSGGSTRFNVGQASLSEVKVSLSESEEEQQKIAAFLTSVDEKLNKLRRKHKLLETYKRGLMQKIFSQEIRFKQDDGSDFPDWEDKPLKALATRCTVKNTDGSNKRVLTNSATQGIIDQQDYFDKEIANAENLEGYYLVELGDFVYNPRISVNAPVGPINRNKIGQGVMSPLYSVFRFRSQNNDFYEYYFKSTFWHRYMSSIANYGARHDRMNITTADFMNLPLPVPCIEEQQKIVSALDLITNKLLHSKNKLTQLESFKKGLLQTMFI